MKIEYMRNSLLVLFALCFLSGSWVQADKSPKSPPLTVTTKDDSLTKDSADRWHRLYVKAWNEWAREANKTPEFASTEATLKKLKNDVQKAVNKSQRALVLAHTSNAIVNFVAEKNLEENTSKKSKESSHRLTIRVLSWPKFLVNGNTFEFSEKISLQNNYSLLQKTHHYNKLKTDEEKNEFALAALSYMVALKKADQTVKQESMLKMKKPNLAQMAGAGKSISTNILGLPEGVTMMNMGRTANLNVAVEKSIRQNKNENWLEKIKAKFSQIWRR